MKPLAFAAALLLPALAFAQAEKGAGSIQVPDLSQLKAAMGSSAEQARPAPAPAPKPALDVTRLAFDAESIRQVVAHNMGDLQECYERVLAESGQKLQGRVVVSFVIGTEGQVLESHPLLRKSTLRDRRIFDCTSVVRGWRFPAPTDNRNHPIEYPFELKVEHKRQPK